MSQSVGKICCYDLKRRGNCIHAAGVGEQRVSQVDGEKRIFKSLMTETGKVFKLKTSSNSTCVLKLRLWCGGITHPA